MPGAGSDHREAGENGLIGWEGGYTKDPQPGQKLSYAAVLKDLTFLTRQREEATREKRRGVRESAGRRRQRVLKEQNRVEERRAGSGGPNSIAITKQEQEMQTQL